MTFGRLVSIFILVAAFAWAAGAVAMRGANESPADVKILRIGHWQLESGIRDAFDQLGKEFAELPQIKKKYGRVQIRQDAIPESVYGPWISTNMPSGTASDIVEIGLGLPQPIWLGYQNRYFLPLTDLANQPNPFNAGTNLEHVPLKNTYGDSMRNGYVEELQEYMRVPLSRFSLRVFYNRTLLRELTGLEKPPEDWRGFIDLCRQLDGRTNSQGKRVFAIAAAKYHYNLWELGLANIPTWSLLRIADFNRDGNVGNDELFVAFRAGVVSFDTPAIRAKFQILAELIKHFQTGFSGVQRVEAVMLFAKSQAVFISTGTWDAGSLIEQGQGSGFEVGLMKFPLPSRDDAEFGKLIFGPAYDSAGNGFPMGVTRFSKNPDLAKDFLLFIASRDGNKKLNDIIQWIPVIDGAPVPPILRGFEPTNQGMWPNVNFDLGGETVIKYQQLISLFQTDPTYTMDKMFADFAPFYLKNGMRDWLEQQRDWRRGIINNERLLTALRGEAIQLAPADPDDPRWIKYRAYTASRQVRPEIDFARQRSMIQNGSPRPVGPYEYLPSAMENVRARIAQEKSK